MKSIEKKIEDKFKDKWYSIPSNTKSRIETWDEFLSLFKSELKKEWTKKIYKNTEEYVFKNPGGRKKVPYKGTECIVINKDLALKILAVGFP